MKIYVVGSLNMDLAVRTARFPARGETVAGDGFMTSAGGKGANQAFAAAKLGGDVRMVGCVGEPFGRELVRSLGESGADTRFVERAEDVSSGIAVIVVEGGDNRIIFDRGANGRLGVPLVRRALAEAARGDLLVVQLEIPVSAAEFALKAAKERGMTTVLNPAPAAPLSAEAFAACDYFTPNQTEAQFYTDVYPDGEARAETCAAALRKMGVGRVVITLGERGSYYSDGREKFSVPAFRVDAVDTTAAGDTFIGALAARLSEGAEAREAMLFASAASAVAVTRRGAQPSIPTRAEAEALLARGAR